jgi:hypothetical protein
MTRPFTRTVLASLLTSTVACNGARNEKSDATTGPDGASSTDTAGQPGPPQPPANTFESPSADELDKLSTALAGHLAAARETTDVSVRTAALQRAIELDPFDVATLAELGRSQLAAAQPFEALRSFELALHHSDDVPQRAALMLELGDVAQMLGNVGRAAELYQVSVALHPSEEASARLSAATGGVEVLSHSSCGWFRHGPPPPELCPTWVQGRDASPSTCIYTHPPISLDDKNRVELFSWLDPSTAIEVYVLNVILDGVWHSSPLTWVTHPAAEHADENVAHIDLRFERLAPEPDPQVVVEFQIERRMVDPATKLLETRTTSNLGVLSVGSSEPRWWLGVRTASTRTVQPHGGGEPSLTQTGVEVKWLPKTGDFELLRTEHVPSAMLGKFVLGAYLLMCPSEIDGS